MAYTVMGRKLPDVGAGSIENHLNTDAVTMGLAQRLLNVFAYAEPMPTAVRSQ